MGAGDKVDCLAGVGLVSEELENPGFVSSHTGHHSGLRYYLVSSSRKGNR